ncbi:MAG: DUF3786 domain-containing protein [Candidatus Omnitrophica bacterium]|nr:DUF3786 domain-containing protein [Candidatus Omnitrophota bacterium]
MGYEKALELAWNDISALTNETSIPVGLFADTYDVDIGKRLILSRSCNAPAKDHTAIILLHYLTGRLKLKKLPEKTGEWIDFNQLEGGEGYYPAFKKRTIDRILKKYGARPEAILSADSRIPIEKAATGDVGVIVRALDGVDILITLWKADGEFAADANILFDKNISLLLCTEDIVVLSEMMAHLI